MLKVFSLLSGNKNIFVKHSEHFINKTKNLGFKEDNLVSFDIGSLFTNFPVNGELHVARKILEIDENFGDKT
jgi:hypothetical protein